MEQTNNEYLYDLLKYAEVVLDHPLRQWQKDMLTYLLKGGVYVAGRSIEKTVLLNVYREWAETWDGVDEIYFPDHIKYTYEQLMA